MARRAPLHELQRLPLGAPDGHARGQPDAASAHRHGHLSSGLLPHPLRLAEEVALLDVLSGGRVNWGAGRGFDPTVRAAEQTGSVLLEGLHYGTASMLGRDTKTV